MEFQSQPPVKMHPQSPIIRFSRWLFHEPAAMTNPAQCYSLQIRQVRTTISSFIWGIRKQIWRSRGRCGLWPQIFFETSGVAQTERQVAGLRVSVLPHQTAHRLYSYQRKSGVD
jgi:hypothetical protein